MIRGESTVCPDNRHVLHNDPTTAYTVHSLHRYQEHSPGVGDGERGEKCFFFLFRRSGSAERMREFPIPGPLLYKISLSSPSFPNAGGGRRRRHRFSASLLSVERGRARRKAVGALSCPSPSSIGWGRSAPKRGLSVFPTLMVLSLCGVVPFLSLLHVQGRIYPVISGKYHGNWRVVCQCGRLLLFQRRHLWLTSVTPSVESGHFWISGRRELPDGFHE